MAGIVAELDLLGVLSKVERSALEQYCQAYGEWRECVRTYEKEGRYIYHDSGNVTEHPACRNARAIQTQLFRYLVEFGATPCARAKTQVTNRPTVQRMRRKRDGTSG